MQLAQYGPWAVIAGGSEGVGASFARKLAGAGINLVLAARKPEPLAALAGELRTQQGVEVRTLALDLRSAGMMPEVRAATDDLEVGMLIYNAGAEVAFGDFHDRDLEDTERLIALNVLAPTRLAHHFGRAMCARKRGGIVIVGSNSCHAGSPRQTIYGATKAYEYALAEGLWYEMAPHNVHVLGLILGATKTPAMERLGIKMDAPGFEGAESDEVAQEGLDSLGVEPICYSGGTAEMAQHLRALPRAEAISLMAQGIAAVGL